MIIGTYEKYLYISSHFFLIPVFLSIYMERYDLLWMNTSVLLTSILRWGNPGKRIYQYIDHNWVKIVVLFFLCSLFDMTIENNVDKDYVLWLFTLLLSIFFFWLSEFIFDILYQKVVVPIHMYVHFYAIVFIISLFHINYDFNHFIYKMIKRIYN